MLQYLAATSNSMLLQPNLKSMILQETFWDNALILERLLQPIKETLKLVEAQSDMSLGQIKHSLVLIAKDIMSYMKQVVITMQEQTSI